MRRVRKRTTTKSSAPAPAFRPASHRVLFVPELLEFIFSYLDREDNVNNACVCKQWSTIGLDMLWRNVDNIFQLFNALCPIDVPDVISGGGPSRTRKFFMDFVTRMPRLTKLDLRVPFSIESVEDIIIDTLLAGLPELRTVIFPEFFFTSRIVTHLATMQHIGVIQFEHGDEQGRGDPADVAHFEPMLLPGAFPQLYDLSLTGRLEHLTAFMNAPTAPINLTQLYLNSYWAQTPAEVHTLFSVLADSCSLLNVLVLELLHIPPGHFYVQGPLADLAPALSLPNLTHFEIMHGAPVHVTFEQLEKLAQSWPSLELLKLNPEPLLALDGYPALGLRALIPFARHCPRLHTLGLFLDDAPTPSLNPFPSLRTLYVGLSRARSPQTVALVLSALCPPGCLLQWGTSWTDPAECVAPEMVERIRERCAPWEEVARLLPVLARLRREERARARRLKYENEELRTVNRVLREEARAIPGGKRQDSCVIC
ncbi:hypothetical protein CONPUDRAFT_129128 [Coniophora puteana RWD-64-598 SS2]|uniref:F-box domain-containing protein n=1 Tax=Coniophora puteana (strain RWD-64-598) TaxID=741705 RepID=A0A5M3MHH4_CONPW|nr:uncharacterized protein CONPUDRAFT_129128 [Coniophora puteana RWD-64-598 SS2]EIW78085.1 hypothetical protein CONPUDRAFT_129128 [Coniophora puteana RWD-64-598 SS2]